MGIAENIKRVQERIEKAALRAGREAEEIRLVAVSKSVETERIIEAVSFGIDTFGENYAQEFREKHDLVEKKLGRKIKWHFIGRLQRNKVKYLLNKTELIHSLDNLSVGEEINKRAEKVGIKVPVLIEVSITDEESKGGLKPEQLEEFLLELGRFSQVDVKGLMTMPPFFDNPEMARPYFKQLRQLRDKLQIRFPNLRELSMGMSGDFEVAIEEGATIVRIGTAIFGARKQHLATN
ncbi:MAG: YggS family pyridoxal phosphate-dependent enzyme [Deltaproteobacteria bacterium]|nr:YggS family pyridoxal phosphate-dependent enzyme [Deltaproteobacteria bacterium]